MKFLGYGGFAGAVIILQIVVVPRMSLGGIAPDGVLVCVCLLGIWRGETSAVAMGVLLGFLQDLLSGGTLWINLMTKPLLGIVAGTLGHAVIAMTGWAVLCFISIVSLLSGVLISVLLLITSPTMSLFGVIGGTVIPQAVYDGVVGALVVWLVTRFLTRRDRHVWNR